MASGSFKSIAIVGCGTIGSSWACLYAVNGYRVSLHDTGPAALDLGLHRTLSYLDSMADLGLHQVDAVEAAKQRIDRCRSPNTRSNNTRNWSGIEPMPDLKSDCRTHATTLVRLSSDSAVSAFSNRNQTPPVVAAHAVRYNSSELSEVSPPSTSSTNYYFEFVFLF